MPILSIKLLVDPVNKDDSSRLTDEKNEAERDE